MKFCVVISKKDLAGLNIAKELRKLDDKINIIEEDKEIIYLENIDKTLNFDFIIFASKHQSKKQVKSLTVHNIGNWKEADFGGTSKKVSPSIAGLNKKMFQILFKKSENLKDFIISMECTHHGPYIEKPSIFIEIGSSKEEWQNPELGKIIAKTIKEFVYVNSSNEKSENGVGIGIGGPHYCNNFNEIQLNSSIAISHVIPEYVLPLNKEMINEALNKTIEKVKYFVIDWKGIGNSESKKQVIDLLDYFSKEKGIQIIKTKEAKKIS